MKTDFRPLIVILIVTFILYTWAGGSIPDVIPDIIPDPAPITEAGLFVLVVEETGERDSLPQGQLDVLTGTLLRSEVMSQGGQYRQFDDDILLDHVHPVWKGAMQLERDSLPWIIVSNHPKGGESVPLPENTDLSLALIKKWSE